MASDYRQTVEEAANELASIIDIFNTTRQERVRALASALRSGLDADRARVREEALAQAEEACWNAARLLDHNGYVVALDCRERIRALRATPPAAGAEGEGDETRCRGCGELVDPDVCSHGCGLERGEHGPNAACDALNPYGCECKPTPPPDAGGERGPMHAVVCSGCAHATKRLSENPCRDCNGSHWTEASRG